jgi:adenylate kinase
MRPTTTRCARGDQVGRWVANDIGARTPSDTGSARRAFDTDAAAGFTGWVRKYVIMGVQGSGKGTQSTMLCEAYDLVPIGVGDIFRWNIQHHTKLGAAVRRSVDSGHLVEDELVAQVVRDRLDAHDWNFGFVIDGFPRNAPQADFFLETYDIDAVINLQLPDEEVERRVLSRRVCSQCGLDYNLIAHRPEVEHTCDVCGGQLEARDDDTPEALATRLRAYYDKTQPVIEIFERKEFVVHIDATPSKQEVFEAIRVKLGLPA